MLFKCVKKLLICKDFAIREGWLVIISADKHKLHCIFSCLNKFFTSFDITE